jgi:thiamine pyrophosphate-dependent acetolactate synthase large subunit-like protein
LSQLATALIVAARAGVPIVVYAGDTALNDPHGVQRFDQARFVDATEAGFVPIWKASEAEEAVRTAFYRARVESRPIVLNAPIDIQAEEYDGDVDEYQTSSTLLPGRQHVQPDADLLRETARVIAEQETRHRHRTGRGRGPARQAITRLADRIGALLSTTLPMKGWLGDSGITSACPASTPPEPPSSCSRMRTS